MPTISALGIGSGLDLNGLLDQLNSAEREKLVPIIRNKKSFEAKISSFGQLRSALANVQSAVKKLNSLDLFDAAKANVTGESITAVAKSGAQVGSYAVSVTNLANAYSVATSGVSSRDSDLGAGTISIALANGDSFSVDVAADASSLEDIRDAINTADAGVNAAIVNDGSGTPYRLTLTSAETGTDAAIASVDFGALASDLALDAATEVVANNAAFKVNGIDIVSQSNTVDDAIEGIELNLLDAGDSTIRVSADVEKISKAISGFVDSFNKLQEQIDKLASYNAETGESGDLFGDSTLRSVNQRIRNIFIDGVSNGEFTGLTDLGISLQLDGKLEIDQSTLNDLVSGERGDVAQFFAAGQSLSTDGFAGKLSTALEGILKDSGVIDNATDGLKSRVDRLDDRYDRIELSISRTVERYRAQFAQLDSLVATMNQTSSYVAQQFDILNSQLNQS